MVANARSAEVTAIGRLLTDYNNLEVGLLHCVQQGIGDFDRAFKTMFAKRARLHESPLPKRLVAPPTKRWASKQISIWR
jgi:hypothetical protein